ncbi:MAG: patatin-like phospholipase family protein [Acidobacteria bacterium]|nr:patatin-like phospholipase family protein [Acidobacteriota bacterium]
MEHRLGIVLSGGGSRGLAHAGVLQALAEAGIHPDCVAGTSSGALVGALWAAGCGTERVLEFFETASPFRISRIAPLRKPGWIDTGKIEADFRPFFPADSFEALDRRLFVAATDLAAARLEIFSSGPLFRPLLASSSIPMLFTPTVIGGRLFADGGILDNFPVEPLLGLCDVILGVYASPLTQVEASGLRSSLAVSQRAFEIGMFHASRRKFHQVELLIAPPRLRDYALFDIRRHREILELGHAAALARMDEIRALVERRR